MAELCKIKGVGLQTVAVILSETNCFKDFHSISQLVSYCGYDGVENQSETRRGAIRISKRGNAHIRRALHFPSFCIKTYTEDPVLVSRWDRLYERTKQKMKAYVAVQRKLLVLLYALRKTGTVYVAGYPKEPCANAGLTYINDRITYTFSFIVTKIFFFAKSICSAYFLRQYLDTKVIKRITDTAGFITYTLASS